jgi:hypothetical protein
MLYELNGVPVLGSVNKWVDVDKNTAFVNFMTMVHFNIFSLRDLLLSDRNVLYGPVRQIFVDNGQDFDTLLRILGLEK